MKINAIGFYALDEQCLELNPIEDELDTEFSIHHTSETESQASNEPSTHIIVYILNTLLVISILAIVAVVIMMIRKRKNQDLTKVEIQDQESTEVSIQMKNMKNVKTKKDGVVPSVNPKMLEYDFKPGACTALNSEQDLKVEDMD